MSGLRNFRKYERFRTTGNIKPGDKCKCRKKFSELYYVWINSKTNKKICNFCYALAEENEKLLPKNWNPEIVEEGEIATRLFHDGPMPLCKKCTLDCKVPLTPNVSKFFCTDFCGLVVKAVKGL